MKIKRIHVEQFGTLSDLSVDFEEGFNQISKENGWGKTTLAVFIRVMFYGFSKKGEGAKDRERYRPWKMGRYGGSLTFSLDQYDYTVYRFFGKSKSGAGDEFYLIDEETKKESGRWTSDLGVELFGLNEESYLNSAWIRRDSCLVTSDITSRLGGKQELLEDVKNFDRISEQLAKRLNHLSPDRKTGVLYRKQLEQQELEMEIQRIPALERRIQQLEEQLAEAEETLGAKESLQKELQEQQQENSARDEKIVENTPSGDLTQRKACACIAIGVLLLIVVFLLRVSVKGNGLFLLLGGTVLLLYGGISLFRENAGSVEISRQAAEASFSRIQMLEEVNRKMTLLNSESRELLLEIQEIRQKLQGLREEREDLVVKEEQVDQLQAELGKLKREYRLTEITARCLREAKDSFSAKFMDTIQRSFLRYYAQIDPEQKEELYIDSGYRICAMGGGLPRTEGVLSSGYRALANFCLRLALLDAMYERERPCIILDDPFVELDDEKYDKAFRLLMDIADRYQILYISCREKQ